MTIERFKELCGCVDWYAVPVPASFDDWLAEYVPDKRLRNKIGDSTVNRTRAKFGIMAEQNGVDLATVMWVVLAQCMRFGMFGANGEPFILYDIDIDIFANKINDYTHNLDFLRFLIGCYADTPEHAQKHAQQIIILQERIAELDGNERGRFEL